MLLLTTLIFSFFSQSFEGEFIYDNSPSVIQAKRFETIFPGTQASQKRISFLKNNNYTCQSKPRVILCSKFLNFESLDALNLKIKQPKNLWIHFGKAEHSSENTKNSYTKKQIVHTQDATYTDPTYVVTTNLIKVNFGKGIHFNQKKIDHEKNTIFTIDNFRKNESRNSWYNYMVQYNYSTNK